MARSAAEHGTPLYPQALLGYRFWGVDQAGQLKPISVHGQERTWEPGLNVAHCSAEAGHAAPVGDCHCGLYAYHSIRRAMHVYRLYRNELLLPSTMEGSVLGVVAGSGRVELHWSGWRAERSQLVALLDDGRILAPLRSKIAANYPVPYFKDAGSLEAYALEHAAPVNPADLPLPIAADKIDSLRHDYGNCRERHSRRFLAFRYGLDDELELEDLARTLGFATRPPAAA